MATIRIGDRDLDVADATIGFWKRVKALSGGNATVDNVAGLIFEAVGHNDGITREWLEDHLPMNSDKLRAKFDELLVANGLQVKEEAPAEGEAAAR